MPKAKATAQPRRIAWMMVLGLCMLAVGGCAAFMTESRRLVHTVDNLVEHSSQFSMSLGSSTRAIEFEFDEGPSSDRDDSNVKIAITNEGSNSFEVKTTSGDYLLVQPRESLLLVHANPKFPYGSIRIPIGTFGRRIRCTFWVERDNSAAAGAVRVYQFKSSAPM
jgi:hypothetical protein